MFYSNQKLKSLLTKSVFELSHSSDYVTYLEQFEKPNKDNNTTQHNKNEICNLKGTIESINTEMQNKETTLEALRKEVKDIEQIKKHNFHEENNTVLNIPQQTEILQEVQQKHIIIFFEQTKRQKIRNQRITLENQLRVWLKDLKPNKISLVTFSDKPHHQVIEKLEDFKLPELPKDGIIFNYPPSCPSIKSLFQNANNFLKQNCDNQALMIIEELSKDIKIKIKKTENNKNYLSQCPLFILGLGQNNIQSIRQIAININGKDQIEPGVDYFENCDNEEQQKDALDKFGKLIFSNPKVSQNTKPICHYEKKVQEKVFHSKQNFFIMTEQVKFNTLQNTAMRLQNNKQQQHEILEVREAQLIHKKESLAQKIDDLQSQLEIAKSLLDEQKQQQSDMISSPKIMNDEFVIKLQGMLTSYIINTKDYQKRCNGLSVEIQKVLQRLNNLKSDQEYRDATLALVFDIEQRFDLY